MFEMCSEKCKQSVKSLIGYQTAQHYRTYYTMIIFVIVSNLLKGNRVSRRADY